MSIRTLIAIIYLKWLRVKRRLIKFLPMAGTSKAKVYNNLKLKQISEKSILQNTVVKELFGAYPQGILFNTENGYLVNSFDYVQVNRYLGNSGSYNFSEIMYCYS